MSQLHRLRANVTAKNVALLSFCRPRAGDHALDSTVAEFWGFELVAESSRDLTRRSPFPGPLRVAQFSQFDSMSLTAGVQKLRSCRDMSGLAARLE